jgi:hypothetical protein
MRKLSILLISLFLINTLFAQVSPKEHFGFTIGDDIILKNWLQAQTESSLSVLDKQKKDACNP